MRSIGGMPGYCRLENDAGFGISVATELVELGDVLLEQATLGFRRYLLFHDADDIVAQLLAGDVGRKKLWYAAKVPAAAAGTPSAAPVICSSLCQPSAVMGFSVVCLRPCRHGAKMATRMHVR